MKVLILGKMFVIGEGGVISLFLILRNAPWLIQVLFEGVYACCSLALALKWFDMEKA